MTPDNDPAEPTIFSAVLTPHRSLSRNGFLILMLILGGLSFTVGLISSCWARGRCSASWVSMCCWSTGRSASTTAPPGL